MWVCIIDVADEDIKREWQAAVIRSTESRMLKILHWENRDELGVLLALWRTVCCSLHNTSEQWRREFRSLTGDGGAEGAYLYVFSATMLLSGIFILPFAYFQLLEMIPEMRPNDVSFFFAALWGWFTIAPVSVLLPAIGYWMMLVVIRRFGKVEANRAVLGKSACYIVGICGWIILVNIYFGFGIASGWRILYGPIILGIVFDAPKYKIALQTLGGVSPKIASVSSYTIPLVSIAAAYILIKASLMLRVWFFAQIS